MSFDEVLKKRIDILCINQKDKETVRDYYQRARNLKNEHREILLKARENYKELFETVLTTEETAIIGYILGMRIEIRKYLHAPCEYKNLKAAAQHAMTVEHRLRKLRLPIIHENNE